MASQFQQPLLAVERPCPTIYPEGMAGNITNNSANNDANLAAGLGSFDLGNGLIEIAALTSLIGSATAQALALGNKGPAGLVWSTITIFGAILGVRSAETDAAVGLSLDLKQDIIRFRTRASRVVGLECETKVLEDSAELARRDIYVFSQRTANIMSAVSASGPGDALKVYSYTPDPYDKDISLYHRRRDWLSLILSTTKLIEVGLLWSYNAVALACVTFLAWLFFFLAGIILHIYGRAEEKRQKDSRTTVIDTIAGTLPTPSKEGGPRKVLLGVPCDPRRKLLWKIIWALGSLVANPRIFFLWTGFQIFWLALRSTFFHIVEDEDRTYQSNLTGQPWANVGEGEKKRVRRLLFALSSYQIHVHPRGSPNYVEDVRSLERLDGIETEYPLAPTESSSVRITVRGVVGDTLLSSVCWISGSKKSGFDFYDTCILILHVKERIYSIPAARALSGIPSSTTPDLEQVDKLERPPRGSSAIREGNKWAYWIPCDDGRWLYFQTDVMKLKGLKDADILTDEQVMERMKNELYISLTHVDEIKETVHTSKEARKYLNELLG